MKDKVYIEREKNDKGKTIYFVVVYYNGRYQAPLSVRGGEEAAYKKARKQASVWGIKTIAPRYFQQYKRNSKSKKVNEMKATKAKRNETVRVIYKDAKLKKRIGRITKDSKGNLKLYLYSRPVEQTWDGKKISSKVTVSQAEKILANVLGYDIYSAHYKYV
jgi:hypothetical protein